MSPTGISLLCLAMTVTSAGSAADYETGAVEHRVISGPDKDGDLLVSTKVMVTNHSDEEIVVNLELQACDSEGFEVFELDLTGKVAANSTVALTDTDYFNAKAYESISHWNIE